MENLQHIQKEIDSLYEFDGEEIEKQELVNSIKDFLKALETEITAKLENNDPSHSDKSQLQTLLDKKDTLKRLRSEYREALLVAKKNRSKTVANERAMLLSGALTPAELRKRKIKKGDELIGAAQDATTALRETTMLMSRELKVSSDNVAVLEESSILLRKGKDKHENVGSVLDFTKRILGELERANWLDRVLILSALLVFSLVAFSIIWKRVYIPGFTSVKNVNTKISIPSTSVVNYVDKPSYAISQEPHILATETKVDNQNSIPDIPSPIYQTFDSFEIPDESDKPDSESQVIQDNSSAFSSEFPDKKINEAVSVANAIQADSQIEEIKPNVVQSANLPRKSFEGKSGQENSGNSDDTKDEKVNDGTFVQPEETAPFSQTEAGTEALNQGDSKHSVDNLDINASHLEDVANTQNESGDTNINAEPKLSDTIDNNILDKTESTSEQAIPSNSNAPEPFESDKANFNEKRKYNQDPQQYIPLDSDDTHVDGQHMNQNADQPEKDFRVAVEGAPNENYETIATFNESGNQEEMEKEYANQKNNQFDTATLEADQSIINSDSAETDSISPSEAVIEQNIESLDINTQNQPYLDTEVNPSINTEAMPEDHDSNNGMENTIDLENTLSDGNNDYASKAAEGPEDKVLSNDSQNSETPVQRNDSGENPSNSPSQEVYDSEIINQSPPNDANPGTQENVIPNVNNPNIEENVYKEHDLDDIKKDYLQQTNQEYPLPIETDRPVVPSAQGDIPLETYSHETINSNENSPVLGSNDQNDSASVYEKPQDEL
ncbi:hypothetical protein BB560_000657 [Smittium megazygosporum]|uniref:Sec20 C-terminal domain-containing protein n=1 Tax=Smittium megazygosporum TaxID=133381 RepID=A0A2T9ZJS8_9FUNG|nr:hypothetical protein BB560_000657 [Smittium megazygosporum]